MHRLALVALVACGSSSPAPKPIPQPPVEAAKPDAPAPPATTGEVLAADTPKTTTAGNPFIAPKDWTIAVKGNATVLTAPERDSWIALVDVKAKSADAALALAWTAYKPEHARRSRRRRRSPTRTAGRRSPSSRTRRRRTRSARSSRPRCSPTTPGRWCSSTSRSRPPASAERSSPWCSDRCCRRAARRSRSRARPPTRSTRSAQLTGFVEDAMKTLGVPGVSIGLVEHGKVVFSGGFGVRALGKPAKPDGDTKYMIASNTKALTTLMLAKLVDSKRLTWETPATAALPQFKLGDADTTAKVQIKHLICACTGMPRQDVEWILEFKDRTPASVLADLAKMQPTTKFGELFQYSNVMAAAAGFLGGHVAFPNLELGKAYDEAMRTLVFAPLGMKATTFDYKLAQTGNFASPHGQALDGKTVPALHELNYSAIPVRPAGAAWSSVNDMLKYVAMELAEGKLPDGKPYISKDALLARRAPQVAIGPHATYGMGLMVSTAHDVTVIHHGGDIFGFHSDMLWLPEHDVGAVILTNGDLGAVIRSEFGRRLLEVLFDGKPEAAAEVAQTRKQLDQGIELAKKQLVIPPDPAEVAKLAPAYTNPALGSLVVKQRGDKLVFDFGEIALEAASKKNPDGTISFVTTSPTLSGLELVVGSGPTKTLVFHDAQREYVFTAK